MWIHLNNGDEGLDRFLEKLSLLANNLIIEPHPWKCYLSMRKRNKKNKVTLPYSLEPLRIRNDVVTHIETKLASLGFELVQVSAGGHPLAPSSLVQQTLGVTKWERKLLWYRRANVAHQASSPLNKEALK